MKATNIDSVVEQQSAEAKIKAQWFVIGFVCGAAVVAIAIPACQWLAGLVALFTLG